MKWIKNAGIIPVSPLLDNTLRSPDESWPEKKVVSGRVFLLSLQAVINAAIIGVIAKGLVLVIQFVTNFAFYGRFSFHNSSPQHNHLGWLVVIVPVAGSFVVGIIARFGSAAIRGHGIPEAMETIIANQSKIPPAITFLKPLSAAISIGTGGPFGAEGPIIATGGAFGSLTGQIMHISSSERKIILAAGACAGMSAIFGSPVAAVLLAIELLLFEFSPRSIIPVALSCTAGAAMHFIFFGTVPVFAMPDIPEPSGPALVIYLLIGGAAGVMAAFVSKSVYWIEDAFEKLPIHWMWWPAIGAVAVGLIGYYAPATMGVGYENISALLTGTLPLTMVIVLCVLKFLSWAVALGSGTSGGTLAPLFTIGGAFGALTGSMVLTWMPHCGINIATAALVGMAAMFAGASRAVLTSIVFAFETTAQPHGLLPLLGACTAAYFVSFLLLKGGSIMTEKIQRRGIRAPVAYAPDILQNITATAVMEDAPFVVDKSNNLADLRAWLAANADKYLSRFVVVTAGEDQFAGYLQIKDLYAGDLIISSDVGKILSPGAPFVTKETPVNRICEIMGDAGMDCIAVISNPDNKLVGVVHAWNIVEAYSHLHLRENAYHTAISLPRRTLKLILRGRTVIRYIKEKADNT
ncbi:MAG TPA: chloride channel protein [Chitinophagaceae bacterium]|nr:chloride channel protein [Chitinophagaceae bacterium]